MQWSKTLRGSIGIGIAGLLCAGVGFAATLTISPSPNYDCLNGEATAVLTWSGASGPVQVHVLSPVGPAVTGVSDPSGSVTTGNWVNDGQTFYLVNQAGVTEATAIARVSCGGNVRTLDVGLQNGSYFPLQVGNVWVYRYNSRFITGEYFTYTITSTEVDNGQTYYVMTTDGGVVGKYRSDAKGVIWALTNSGEQVFLDPTNSSTQKSSYSGPLGVFPDAVATSSLFSGVQFTRSIYVRGIGLANQQSSLMTGSSGGFTDGLELIETRLNGVRLVLSASAIHLGLDTTDLDISDHMVPNCALPCYFVACGLGGPPPDPAGTYRPCTDVRVETTGVASDSVQLQMLDSSGTAVFSVTEHPDPSGTSFNYVRLPLFIPTTGSTTVMPNPFTLLPAGNYQLVAKALSAGAVTSSATVNVRVR